MRVFIYLASLSVWVSLLGCSSNDSKTGKVTGKVTLDNVPLEIGSVVMITDDGKRSGAGPIGAGGIYVVPNAPLGNVKITLSLPPGMETPMPADAPDVKDVPIKGKDNPKGIELPKGVESGLKATGKVPQAYQIASRSPLRFTVKDGENQHDITLKADEAGVGNTGGGEAGQPPMPPMPPMPPGPPK